jgi:hypothetical protein
VAVAEPPVEAGLVEEWRRFNECLATAPARERMRAFLELGGQTREVEAKRDAFAGDWLTV